MSAQRRRAYLFELADAGEGQWGGIPPGVDEARWPTCGCGRRMQFALLFHAHPERLPLAKQAALAVFLCEDPDGMCETSNPFSGGNAVLMLSPAVLATPALATPPGGDDAPAVIERKSFKFTECLEAVATEKNVVDKLGGAPLFYQGEQVPACTVCNKPQRFVAQFYQGQDLHFGNGFGYLFVCDDEHESRFLWQC